MVTVSSVEPINITIGRANTTPRMDMSTVAQKVNRSPWRTTRLAFSWSPRPRFLATRPWTPVFIETNAAISRNLAGWSIPRPPVPGSHFQIPPSRPWSPPSSVYHGRELCQQELHKAGPGECGQCPRTVPGTGRPPGVFCLPSGPPACFRP